MLAANVKFLTKARFYFFQIDLGDLFRLSSITIKGRKFGDTNQFVKSFTVDYTLDGYTWHTYSRRSGIDVVSI
jgi:hypothetical protein